ncbi:hypothetical protein V1478_000894, partial [Vespula squamosa]
MKVVYTLQSPVMYMKSILTSINPSVDLFDVLIKLKSPKFYPVLISEKNSVRISQTKIKLRKDKRKEGWGIVEVAGGDAQSQLCERSTGSASFSQIPILVYAPTDGETRRKRVVWGWI